MRFYHAIAMYLYLALNQGTAQFAQVIGKEFDQLLTVAPLTILLQ